MKKGDIVLVSFPFTNLKGTKRRPAILLHEGVLDVIVIFITSKSINPSNTDLPIAPGSNNGLKKTSIIRTDKIATIDKDLVKGKIGELRF